MSQDPKGDASSQRAGVFGTGQGWRPSFNESRRRAEAGPAGIARRLLQCVLRVARGRAWAEAPGPQQQPDPDRAEGGPPASRSSAAEIPAWLLSTGGPPLWTEETPLSGKSDPSPQPGTGPPAAQQLTLASSLIHLSLDPLRLPERTLSPRLAESIPSSACQPEMTLSPGLTKLTLDPTVQPEETPIPSLAELTLEPVHCRPELLDACADLINEQWPRSRASRLHSLGQSSDAFPLCLMLLAPCPTPKAAPIVVGHARLSRVLNRPQSLLVETVVVARALRGRGFGRRLMEGLEDFAQARGFHRLHLTTQDQLHFYTHLGYRMGDPVQGLVFASQKLPTTLLSAFSKVPSLQSHNKAPCLTVQAAPEAPREPSSSLLPPPPPPLPEPLATCPPPPTGPLPQSLQETQYHNMRGCLIFWMEKDI